MNQIKLPVTPLSPLSLLGKTQTISWLVEENMVHEFGQANTPTTNAAGVAKLSAVK